MSQNNSFFDGVFVPILTTTGKAPLVGADLENLAEEIRNDDSVLSASASMNTDSSRLCNTVHDANFFFNSGAAFRSFDQMSSTIYLSAKGDDQSLSSSIEELRQSVRELESKSQPLSSECDEWQPAENMEQSISDFVSEIDKTTKESVQENVKVNGIRAFFETFIRGFGAILDRLKTLKSTRQQSKECEQWFVGNRAAAKGGKVGHNPLRILEGVAGEREQTSTGDKDKDFYKSSNVFFRNMRAFLQKILPQGSSQIRTDTEDNMMTGEGEQGFERYVFEDDELLFGNNRGED